MHTCVHCIDERKKLLTALSIPNHITGILFHLKIRLGISERFEIFHFPLGHNVKF